MLTIAHADRGRPTLKDDERFRNGYFHDNNIHKHDKLWSENLMIKNQNCWRSNNKHLDTRLLLSIDVIIIAVHNYYIA